MSTPFRSLRGICARALWRALWTALLPITILYLLLRGRKDPRYRKHLGERFGGGPTLAPGAIWIHAVSLGEVRSAVPLARELLARGERILFTHGTPAGRAEVEKVFAEHITDQTVQCRYFPVEQAWAYRRFFRRVRPKLGLVMEVEFWPVMIASAAAHKVPLYLCNGQYPGKSFEKNGWFRKSLPSGFAGVLVKSKMMADRFHAIGCLWIAITGELRFEQPIPDAHIAAGQALRPRIPRPVITLSSVVQGEDELFLDRLAAMPRDTRPLVVYVPRAAERFNAVWALAEARGLSIARRSQVLTDDLKALADFDPEIDILLGDSMGEMYFYLTLADQVLVGGGFTPKASHNIIESLAVGKPVAVGPNIHTIEYPGQEAIAAGICTHLQTEDDVAELFSAVRKTQTQDPAVQAFLAAHSGAVGKTIKALDRLTSR